MGFCQEAAIDMETLIRFCGDDDGCSVHLTSDALVRAISDVVRLVFNPVTYQYTLHQGGYEGLSFSGTVGDFSAQEVFSVDSPAGKRTASCWRIPPTTTPSGSPCATRPSPRRTSKGAP